MQLGYRMQYVKPEISGEDLAFLQYTGGTTGAAKGAMLTHYNMLANVEQGRATYLPAMQLGKEIIVTALPLYHIFALTVNCLLFVKIGGTNLLITNPRDIAATVKELARYPFTGITGVNTLFNAWLRNEEFRKLDFSHLHVSIGGGMPVQKEVAEEWQQITGKCLLEGYGLTECSPLVTVNPYNLDRYNGSIGLPMPSTDVKFVDYNGNEVPIGQPGEMLVRGPQVMKGYWRSPIMTDEVLQDGWLATGDIATIDEKGFIKIVDRKKDMILVSGFNVYPSEIEEVISNHPKVIENAAIGVIDENTGEAVKVFVVASDPNLTADDLKIFCRQYLTAYKVPKFFEFRSTELPKSNVGKILRRQLREEKQKKYQNSAENH